MAGELHLHRPRLRAMRRGQSSQGQKLKLLFASALDLQTCGVLQDGNPDDHNL